MAGEGERVKAYQDTLGRMELDIAMVDRDAALASIAISLKRIADALESDMFSDRLCAAIERGIWSGSQKG